MDIIGTLNQILVFATAVAIVASPILILGSLTYKGIRKLATRTAQGSTLRLNLTPNELHEKIHLDG